MKASFLCTAAIALFGTAALATRHSAFVRREGRRTRQIRDRFRPPHGHIEEPHHLDVRDADDYRPQQEHEAGDGSGSGRPSRAKASLTIAQPTDLTALKTVPAGKTKDDFYIKQQKAAHNAALALMQQYASTGSAHHLKVTAAKRAPVIEKHQSMLSTM